MPYLLRLKIKRTIENKTIELKIKQNFKIIKQSIEQSNGGTTSCIVVSSDDEL